MPFLGFRWVVVVFAVACATFARADVVRDVDGLIATEAYAEAKALATAALAQPEQRETALTLLFNLVVESPADFTEAEWSPWLAELTQRRSAAHARARSLAPLALWRAQQAFQSRDRDGALAGVDEALALLRDGDGRISPAERAYVLAVGGQIRGMVGDYAAGAALAGEGVAALKTPKDNLERVRRLRALYFQALFEDRLAHYDTSTALARQGIAEAEALASPNNGYRRRLIGALSESLISRGDFTAVRALMRPELERLRALPAPSPRELAMTLGHLGEAERQLGDRERALDLYRESAQHAATDPGVVASGSYAAILGNLGALAYELKRYDEADAALGRNLSLLEQQFGSDTLRIVPALINTGELAYERNLLDEAEQRFRRVLAIVAARLGAEHSEGAPALRGLALVHLRRGDAAAAAALLRGAIAQQEAAAGTEHVQLLAWRCDLSEALAQSGDRTGAFDNALVVEQRRNHLVATVAPVLGETQALEFKRGLARCSERLLAIAADGGDAARIEAAWNAIAAARGLATRLSAQRIAAAREHADAAAAARWERWSKAAQGYADAVRGGNDGKTLAALRRELDAAIEALGDGTPLQPLSRVPIAQLLTKLPPQTALAAFVAGAGGREPQLYAFVAQAGAPTRLVALGGVEALDARAERWYRLMREPGRDEALREAGLAVRRHLFDALRVETAGRRLFIVADAGVHRLNFAALPDGDGFLVERGLRPHLLETEQDLATTANVSRDGLLLLGVPELARSDASALGNLRGGCPELDTALEPLPGAEREIDTLAQLSRAAGRGEVVALKGTAATATALRRAAPQSGIIHFATHAFEIGAGCAARAGSARRGVGLRRDEASATSASAALAREAGLVLSGERGRNGLLLGADVGTLALAGVGWVVLSACDTGLGARLDDEGVFGLRRAFRLAGARTVLMSLWPVDDAATSAWMEALYRARLHQQRTTVDAVADADLAVLAARRDNGESVHPFYWAGFVAAGDWR